MVGTRIKSSRRWLPCPSFGVPVSPPMVSTGPRVGLWWTHGDRHRQSLRSQSQGWTEAVKPRPSIPGYFGGGGRGPSPCPLRVSVGDTRVILATPDPPPRATHFSAAEEIKEFNAAQKRSKQINASVQDSIKRTSVKTLSDKETKELRPEPKPNFLHNPPIPGGLDPKEHI